MNPVCYGCRTEMVCDKTGIEVSPSPFTYIRADRFRCPLCGQTVVANFSGKAAEKPWPGSEVVELGR